MRALRRAGRRVRDAAWRNGWGLPIWAATALAISGFVAAEGAERREMDVSAVDRQTAAVLSSRSDRLRPADAAVFLRTAYVETREGELTPAAVAAVRRSYALEPLGPDATAWRLTFVFQHWTAMPQDVRDLALAELEASFPRHGWAMRGIPGTVSDPSGRMAAYLAFRRQQAIANRGGQN